MKTRGKALSIPATEVRSTLKSANSMVRLAPDEPNPPHLFVSPQRVSEDSRIISLQHPRYDKEARFLICPETGFYEFKKIAIPRSTPRSWLLSRGESPRQVVEPCGSQDEKNGGGYIISSADLLIATPIDPLFIIMPYLVPKTLGSDQDTKKLFLCGDDYLDKLTNPCSVFGICLKAPNVRSMLLDRLSAVCDTVEAGDETMFRLNEEKLVKEMMDKAARVMGKGLPTSMEEKIIQKALETPLSSVTQEQSTFHEMAKEEDENYVSNDHDTQSTTTSVETAASSFSENSASTAMTSFSEDSASRTPTSESKVLQYSTPDGIVDLLRLRTALLFILSSYVAPHISEVIMQSIAISPTVVDFAPLDAHLARLAQLRREALASRSIGDYSRKRVLDEEESEVRAEKRRKEEEDKKRKANESRGVKALKKVNTSGMKKMSDFFKKK